MKSSLGTTHHINAPHVQCLRANGFLARVNSLNFWDKSNASHGVSQLQSEVAECAAMQEAQSWHYWNIMHVVETAMQLTHN